MRNKEMGYPVHRITELSDRQQLAIVEFVNRLVVLQLPDDFVETVVRRAGNDAEAIWRHMMDEGFARAIDSWIKENIPAILNGKSEVR